MINLKNYLTALCLTFVLSFAFEARADERSTEDVYIINISDKGEDSKGLTITEKNLEDQVNRVLQALRENKRKVLRKLDSHDLNEKERQLLIHYLRSGRASAVAVVYGIEAGERYMEEIKELRTELRELMLGKKFKRALKTIQDEVQGKEELMPQ